MAAAERQYREVLAGRPTSSQVRVALAEALLHQRRYVDAALEAGAVPGDDAFAAAGSADRALGLPRRRGSRACHGGQAKAAAVGVPASQLEVFEAWASLLRRDQAPRRLPVAAAPLLGAILETLLSTQDFKTFELLDPD